MLHDRGQGNAQGLGQRGRRGGPPAQLLDHPTPVGIGEGTEEAGDGRWMAKHWLQHMKTPPDSQALT